MNGEMLDLNQLHHNLHVPPPPPQPQPTRETHPDVRFWDKADYSLWCETPGAAAQIKARGKLPYLEHADGSALDENTVKAIRRLLCIGCNELVLHKIAPQKWGQATPSAIKRLKDLMERAHPLFTFANHGWKLDHLIVTHYPCWARSQFGKGHSSGTKDSDTCNETRSESGEVEKGPGVFGGHTGSSSDHRAGKRRQNTPPSST